MSKVLVIVYSHTGTSRNVAKLLCMQQDWQMGEVFEAAPAAGRGNLRCVLESLFRLRPPIRYEGPPPEDFDAVVLVSPVWLLRLAGPMRSFVADYCKWLPEIAVISVMGGSGGPNAAAEIAQLVGREPALSTTFTAREVDDGSCAARLKAFGTAVASAGASQETVRPMQFA
ncbi:flavodoxin [Variovorax humicola]|uniref:Flavodoxin n=1 Tax=Variovorax humicola TaxID=1769758 RepID=A0ABU8WDD6_9BURK